MSPLDLLIIAWFEAKYSLANVVQIQYYGMVIYKQYKMKYLGA